MLSCNSNLYRVVLWTCALIGPKWRFIGPRVFHLLITHTAIALVTQHFACVDFSCLSEDSDQNKWLSVNFKRLVRFYQVTQFSFFWCLIIEHFSYFNFITMTRRLTVWNVRPVLKNVANSQNIICSAAIITKMFGHKLSEMRTKKRKFGSAWQRA